METILTPTTGPGPHAPDEITETPATDFDTEGDAAGFDAHGDENTSAYFPENSARPSQVPTPDLSALEGMAYVKVLLDYVLARLEEEKAGDIVSISLEGKSEIADTMVIASGRSARHVSAVADKLLQSLKQAGMQDIKVEGQPACDWVLIDAGDVIIHLFRPEVREFYNLERIWSETARAPVSAENVTPVGFAAGSGD